MPKKKQVQVENTPVEKSEDNVAEVTEEVVSNETKSEEPEARLSRKEVIAQKRASEEKRANRNSAKEALLMQWASVVGAHREKSILNGRIISVEEMGDKVVAVVKLGDFRVIIPCEEMYIDNPLDKSTVHSEANRIRRERQMLAKVITGEIPFVITNISGSPELNGEGGYAIIGSRKEAITKIANRNFNRKQKGSYLVNEGDDVEANIISVGPHAVFANVKGVDMTIPVWRLSHRYIPDARELYKPGDVITVRIMKIVRDDNGNYTDVIVSGKESEVPEFIPRVKAVKQGTMAIAKVTHIGQIERKDEEGNSIKGVRVSLFLDDLNIPARSSYSRIDTLTVPINTGDDVLIDVHKVIPEGGFVIATIMRKV